jgi:phosphohistidine phosphatase SixA
MSHSTEECSSSKTIYLIRHGVARHNVRGPRGEKPDLLDPSYTDPELIRQGEIQASVLGDQLRRRGLTIDDNSMNIEDNDDTIKPIELVVCSPLTRCLQTASYIFPSHFASNTPSNQSSESSSPFILDRNCKVCCHNDVREAFGVHYPDKRR